MRYRIAGLGNPGQEYDGTRHNAGRAIVACLARKWDLGDFSKEKRTNALTVAGKIGKNGVDIVLPETYMNKSGGSLTGVRTKKDAASLIVIHDELDLPLGRFKISFGKSAGGHKGVESIIKAVKTNEFIRIRVGISPSTARGKLKKPHGEDLVDFVLGRFRKPEEETLKKVSKKVREAVEMILAEGKDRAMGAFNQ